MADFINVAVDAMGGDNAPVEIVKGVVDAVHANNHVKVYLTGQEELVRRELEKYTYPADRRSLKPQSLRLWQSAARRILPLSRR